MLAAPEENDEWSDDHSVTQAESEAFNSIYGNSSAKPSDSKVDSGTECCNNELLGPLDYGPLNSLCFTTKYRNLPI